MRKSRILALSSAAVLPILAALVISSSSSGLLGQLHGYLGYVLNPQGRLTLGAIIAISFILGMLHGATPDEHTWPITFSYAIGSYSTRKGAKAGMVFSAGFTVQRALLTTLGFLGLAAVYKAYNLNGPVYIIVGIVMAIAGAYVLRKRLYIHLPFDMLLHGRLHHSESAERIPLHDHPRDVPVRMAFAHGLIAGFGFGAYATIITFVLAPHVPGLIYAPLPGLFFGIGTMAMQVVFGALFAGLARRRRLSDDDIRYVGRKTGGQTLYYGGMFFALIGLLIVAFPAMDSVAVATGVPIPNLDSIGVSTVLVLVVVGVIGISTLVRSVREISRMREKKASA